MEYVLARRLVIGDNRWEQLPVSNYSSVDMFDNYSDANRERMEQQRDNPEYVYEIFTKDEWNKS
jgi:hypothetical protein